MERGKERGTVRDFIDVFPLVESRDGEAETSARAGRSAGAHLNGHARYHNGHRITPGAVTTALWQTWVRLMSTTTSSAAIDNVKLAAENLEHEVYKLDVTLKILRHDREAMTRLAEHVQAIAESSEVAAIIESSAIGAVGASSD